MGGGSSLGIKAEKDTKAATLGSSLRSKPPLQRKSLGHSRDMELSSAPLHKGQLPWRGLLLTGEETFLRGVDSRGAQRLDGVFWEGNSA